MKKTLILLIVLLLIIAGCSKFTESTLNEDELNIVSGVSMSEVILKDGKLTFTLINGTDETINYGTPILLEKKKNNKWYEVPFSYKTGFTMELLFLNPGSEDETAYALETWNRLSSGTYRFVKEFYVGENSRDKKYIFREFKLK